MALTIQQNGTSATAGAADGRSCGRQDLDPALPLRNIIDAGVEVDCDRDL
jgi:hypothetical protein